MRQEKKMRLKKMLAVLLAVLLVCTAMPVGVFAESGGQEAGQVPNYMAGLWKDNWDCTETKAYEALKNESLQVTIANPEDRDESVTMDLKWDEELQEYIGEGYRDDDVFKKIFGKIKANQDAVYEQWENREISYPDYFNAVFKGFTLELQIPRNDHFVPVPSGGGIRTADEVIAEFEEALELYFSDGNYGEGQAAPESYQAMKDLYLQNLEALAEKEGLDKEITAEMIAEMEAELDGYLELDGELAAAKAGTYEGRLYLITNLQCDCEMPYDVYHYYAVEKDGELEEITMLTESELVNDGESMLYGKRGDAIKGTDYIRDTYNGQSFTYKGSYEYEAVNNGNWDKLKMDQFVLGGMGESNALLQLYVIPEDQWQGEEGSKDPFAPETEHVVIPNFMGIAMLDNPDCKEFKSYENLNLEIRLTNDADPTQYFTVPLKYDKTMQTYNAETYLEQAFVPGIIDDIMENQKATLKKYGLDEESLQDEDAAMDALDQLTDLDALSALLMEGVFDGYTITLNGLGEDSHFKAKLFDGGVKTGADQLAAFELLLTLFGPEDGFKEGEEPTSFIDLLDYIAKTDTEGEYESYEDVLKESGLFGEGELEMLIELMEKADLYLAAARDGSFPNQLGITMTLLCGCPVMIDYEIYHQYMIEKDGKLIEIDMIQDGEPDEFGMYVLRGESGQVIRGEDFVKETYEGFNKEFVGKTFTFEGSYDSMATWEEDQQDWSLYALDEYTLSEDYEHFGLVLRYVLEEEPADEPVVDEPATEEKPAAVEKPKAESKPEADEQKETAKPVSAEKAPATGDYSPIGIYAALLVTAIGAVALLFFLKRKNKDRNDE